MGQPTSMHYGAVLVGGIREGTIQLALLAACFQSLPPLPTSKLAFLVLIPRWMGLYGSLQQTLLWGWEFLTLPPQSPRCFQSKVWGFISLHWNPGLCGLSHSRVVSHGFICTRMWDHPLFSHRLAMSLLCPAACLLLPVWMNVSSLTPLLSDFHTVQFSVSSGCFLFLNLLLTFSWLCE